MSAGAGRRRRWLRSVPRPVDVDEGYARWAEGYDLEAERPLSRIEMRATLELLPEVAGMLCVDAACGTGRYVALLGRRGARVIAVDRSAAMLRVLQGKGSGAVLVRGDLRALPLIEGRADLVICTLALGHLAELAVAVAEAGRLLRSGGILVASDFHAAASDAGLLRTCVAGGEELALPHHPHRLADYERALPAAGLVLERHVEATAEGEPEAFRGRRRLTEAERRLPLVLALRARRVAR